ncbi:Urea active transporter [Venturia inaequalis]|nr:Urea active transporter [Venturia inaequalis]
MTTTNRSRLESPSHRIPVLFHIHGTQAPIQDDTSQSCKNITVPTTRYPEIMSMEDFFDNRPPSHMSRDTLLPNYASIEREPPSYDFASELLNEGREDLDMQVDSVQRGDRRWSIEVRYHGDDITHEQGGGSLESHSFQTHTLNSRISSSHYQEQDSSLTRPAPVHLVARSGNLYECEFAGGEGLGFDDGGVARVPAGCRRNRRYGFLDYVLYVIMIVGLLVFVGWAIAGAVNLKHGVESV